MARPLEAQIENMEVSADVQTLMRWHKYEHLTCLQVSVLLMVIDNPGCSTGAIAEVLNIHKPAITRSVQKLIALDLVTSEIDLEDRRMVKLYPEEDIVWPQQR